MSHGTFAGLEDAGEAPVSDEVSTAMPEFRPSSDTPRQDSAARCHGVRDRILAGLVLYTLVRTSEALAGDQAAVTRVPLDPELGDHRQSPPLTTPSIRPLEYLAAPIDAGNPVFSSTDFRPRKATLFDRDPSAAAFDDLPMLHGTTVWQRMADYKSHDRVRLLTLWESRGSTISLQAGRKGDPSLQWTSRLMNRGGSTRGLLDRWFSVSLANAGNSLRGVSRSMTAPAPSKQQLNIPVNAGLK
jgi:hypothetical protein